MEWALEIQNSKGKLRQIRLDHDYATEEEADREAEELADIEYKETDIAWSIVKVK